MEPPVVASPSHNATLVATVPSNDDLCLHFSDEEYEEQRRMAPAIRHFFRGDVPGVQYPAAKEQILHVVAQGKNTPLFFPFVVVLRQHLYHFETGEISETQLMSPIRQLHDLVVGLREDLDDPWTIFVAFLAAHHPDHFKGDVLTCLETAGSSTPALLVAPVPVTDQKDDDNVLDEADNNTAPPQQGGVEEQQHDAASEAPSSSPPSSSSPTPSSSAPAPSSSSSSSSPQVDSESSPAKPSSFEVVVADGKTFRGRDAKSLLETNHSGELELVKAKSLENQKQRRDNHEKRVNDQRQRTHEKDIEHRQKQREEQQQRHEQDLEQKRKQREEQQQRHEQDLADKRREGEKERLKMLLEFATPSQREQIVETQMPQPATHPPQDSLQPTNLAATRLAPTPPTRSLAPAAVAVTTDRKRPHAASSQVESSPEKRRRTDAPPPGLVPYRRLGGYTTIGCMPCPEELPPPGSGPCPMTPKNVKDAFADFTGKFRPPNNPRQPNSWVFVTGSRSRSANVRICLAKDHHSWLLVQVKNTEIFNVKPEFRYDPSASY